MGQLSADGNGSLVASENDSNSSDFLTLTHSLAEQKSILELGQINFRSKVISTHLMYSQHFHDGSVYNYDLHGADWAI